MKSAWIIFRKEIRLETATGERVVSMLLFAMLCAVIFHFTILTGNQAAPPDLAAGSLWVVFLFSTTLGLNRAFYSEKEYSAWDGLWTCPLAPESMFLGKFLFNFLLSLVVELLVWLAFSVLFQIRVPPGAWVFLVGSLVLATAALSALGTFIGAMAVHTRRRDIIFPVLYFPLAAPVLLLGARGWEQGLRGEYQSMSLIFQQLGACAILFFIVGILLFEYIAKE